MSAPHSNDVPKSDLVVTLAALEPVPIGDAVDLNNITSTGLYHQPSTAHARNGANYPVQTAGLLRVAASSSMVYQLYIPFGTGTIFSRVKYVDTWTQWKEFSAEGHKHSWSDITDPPSSFKPSLHTHDVPDINATGRTTSNFLRGDGTWATPTNTTYSVMSEAEATAGTATTARTTSASGLKGAIQRWATGTYTTAISAIGQALNRAATAAEARDAIGAGTSNLAIGTTASTAKAGNWTPTWSEVTSKPTSFPPSTHTHTMAQVTGLQAELDGKASAARPGVEVWYGTAAEYNALPTATRNAAGFIAVLT